LEKEKEINSKAHSKQFGWNDWYEDGDDDGTWNLNPNTFRQNKPWKVSFNNTSPSKDDIRTFQSLGLETGK
jgi:hypothetical protein